MHADPRIAVRGFEVKGGIQEDTVGVCSACLDVIANLKALKKGIKEVQCMHANITTFRTEVKTWLANQKVHIACLQETHLPEEKLQEVATSLAGMGYQTWCEAAAKTEHGTSGGLMCAAKRHLNFGEHLLGIGHGTDK